MPSGSSVPGTSARPSACDRRRDRSALLVSLGSLSGLLVDEQNVRLPRTSIADEMRIEHTRRVLGD
jgi:hypothetical protein